MPNLTSFKKVRIGLKLKTTIATSIIFLLLSNSAFCGTVVKLLKKRKTVVIDIGSNDDVTKGSKVCIIRPNGKKAACGTVRRVTATKSFVRINPKRFKRVKKGMTAEISETTAKKSMAANAATSGSIVFRGNYIFALMPPTTFQQILFSPGTDQESAWSDEGVAQPPQEDPLNLGLEVSFPIFGMDLGVGFRLRNRKFISTADYEAQTRDPYVETTLTESATALWFTAYFLKTDVGIGQLTVGGGLDIDMATLNISVLQKSDSGDESEIFSGTSKLMIISLAGTSHLDIKITESFGAFFGTRLLFPVSGGVGSLAGDDITDASVVASTTANPNDDLAASINYKAASFGVAFHIGAMLAF